MIVLHLPYPPSVNEANKFSKRGYYPSNAKRDFFRDANALFLSQKRALSGARVEGAFTSSEQGGNVHKTSVRIRELQAALKPILNRQLRKENAA